MDGRREGFPGAWADRPFHAGTSNRFHAGMTKLILVAAAALAVAGLASHELGHTAAQATVLSADGGTDDSDARKNGSIVIYD
ncbi:hypothetical protein GCM10029964_099510 [Kibdelosporangium lantanae]